MPQVPVSGTKFQIKEGGGGGVEESETKQMLVALQWAVLFLEAKNTNSADRATSMLHVLLGQSFLYSIQNKTCLSAHLGMLAGLASISTYGTRVPGLYSVTTWRKQTRAHEWPVIEGMEMA